MGPTLAFHYVQRVTVMQGDFGLTYEQNIAIAANYFAFLPIIGVVLPVLIAVSVSRETLQNHPGRLFVAASCLHSL
jgi:hypothetical protein